MLRAISLISASAVLLASPQDVAPKIASEAEAKALVEKTLSKFVAEDFKGGFDLLAPYWNAPRNELDTLQMQTMQQRSTIKPRYGESIGFEFINQKTAGRSFLKFTYVEKLQNTGIRYTFIFYRPKDTWLFQGMWWDDKLALLFGE